MTPETSHKAAADPLDICLVEDNPGDARLIQEAFAETEHETAINHVTTGDEALDLLVPETDDRVPDLVLLDLNLPRMDGFQILSTIRDDQHLQRLPVIILTSSKDEEDIARSYDAAANAYLTKPTDPCDYVLLAESIEEFWFNNAELPPD